MNSEKAAPPEVLFGGKPLAIFAATMLGLFALLFFTLRADRLALPRLETARERVSVGDTDFFPVPTSRDKMVATWQGQPLYPIDIAPRKIRDGKMQRVGEDEATQRSIYHLRDDAGEGKVNADSLWLKTERDRYLEVQPKEGGR